MQNLLYIGYEKILLLTSVIFRGDYLSTIFLVVEFIGSIVTGSLALLSDAAHMLTDVSALMVSLASIYIAKRASDYKRTFGYHRFEILAAAFNAILLFIVAIYIFYEGG